MLNQFSFICSPKHYKIITFFSCFNDLNEYTEPYMKIACFGWGKFTKNMDFSTRTGFMQCHHRFSLSRHTNEQIYV